MRTLLRTVTAAPALAATLALAACSSGTNDPKKVDGSSGTGGRAASVSLHVGQTAHLTDDKGHPFDVTLVKVVDRARATGTYDQVPKTQRIYAAEFTVTNHASTTPLITSALDVFVRDSAGTQYDIAPVDKISSGPEFTSGLRVKTGATVDAWLPFGVPTGTAVATVVWPADVTRQTDTATWTV